MKPTAERIVETCDADPPEDIDAHPKLFSDFDGRAIDEPLFKLFKKGVVDAEWDEDEQTTRYWLTEFGVELNERGLMLPYIASLEGAIKADAGPQAFVAGGGL